MIAELTTSGVNRADLKMLASQEPGVACDYLQERQVSLPDALILYADGTINQRTLGLFDESQADGDAVAKARARKVQDMRIEETEFINHVLRADGPWHYQLAAYSVVETAQAAMRGEFNSVSDIYRKACQQLRQRVLCIYEGVATWTWVVLLLDEERHFRNMGLGDVSRWLIAKGLRPVYPMDSLPPSGDFKDGVQFLGGRYREYLRAWEFQQELSPADLTHWWHEDTNPLGVESPLFPYGRTQHWKRMEQQSTMPGVMSIRCCSMPTSRDRLTMMRPIEGNGPLGRDKVWTFYCAKCNTQNWMADWV